MRKVVWMLALASFLGSTQVSAQGFMKKMMSTLYGGPKVEANMSHLFLSDLPGVEGKMNVGGSVGGFLGMRMSEHFAVQEDIMMHYKTSTLEQDGVEGDFEYIGAEITFYAMGNWTLNNGGRLLLGVGPFAGYGISAKYKVDGVETNLYEKNGNDEAILNPLNVGAAVTVGYELKCGLQINASCKYGIMNMLDANKENAAMRPGTISLGVAYRFGK